MPTLTRATKATAWKSAHLFFPTIIHVLTDKYERRHHHLIIDTVYSVITFVLIGANIGLAVWFYLYLSPAQVDTRVFTTSHISSGEEMSVAVSYYNPHRNIDDVKVDVFLPAGFISEDEQQRGPIHFEIGDLEEHNNGLVEFEGRVFGSIGETYDVRVVTSYTYLTRRQYETVVHRFTVSDASFDVEISFPPVVIYDVPVSGTVKYTNTSTIDRRSVELGLALPANFTLTSVYSGDQQLSVAVNGTHTIQVGPLAAGQSGALQIAGVFQRPAEGSLAGDIQSGIDVTATTTIFSITSQEEVTLFHGTNTAPVQIVAPRLTAQISGDTVVNFGQTIEAQVLVTNIGEHTVKDITVSASVSGEPVSMSIIRMQHGQNGSTESASGTNTVNSILTSPMIKEIQPGQQATVTVTMPTREVSGENISSTLRITGEGFVPEVNATVPLEPVEMTTKYNSQVTLQGTALYFGPNDEQIGYGAYPPRPWEITSMRVILSVTNLNNNVSNVRIRTTLPSQVEWTGLYSVSAGTSLLYNAGDHSIEWVIPSLAPQQLAYGAQFEVLFTPNHLQIGQQPRLTNSMSISAADSFTASLLRQSAPAILVPVAVVE